ncbi:hypothetical protein P153DRAFT_368997 [Dothidotthia symphoricarpi CBS 119687]|uniref:DNA glycosylase n=1 Tax=Dothidotthia symphoricarpi CBS 119687 TaxID=1392245 RepID=A0A6A6A5Z9_9PLEO|nr:uncharacterized protein P153DRAFT_368997 [Dothidotthia symphoricarpi CBS 119687]KAF2126976.1 hypothetical protein P153DRAFT_368997 [Dothidotthia symphoricarpi CBS 119687]
MDSSPSPAAIIHTNHATPVHQKRKRLPKPVISPFFAKLGENTVSRTNKSLRNTAASVPRVRLSGLSASTERRQGTVIRILSDPPVCSQKLAKRKTSRRLRGPTISPYFSSPLTKPQPVDPFSLPIVPPGLGFTLEPAGPVGLIQERICRSLFALVVQAMLWNKTRGTAGRPVLFQLLCTYPTPEILAAANEEDLVNMIWHLGLQCSRASNLIKMAAGWIEAPPRAETILKKKTFKPSNNGGCEISHLHGVGQYAEDSFRIFGRDRLRAADKSRYKFEPEWKRVIPQDKDLRRYIRWKWEVEGYEYDYESGRHWKKKSPITNA